MFGKAEQVSTLHSDKQCLPNCYTFSLELALKYFCLLKILFNMNFTKKVFTNNQVNFVFGTIPNKYRFPFA